MLTLYVIAFCPGGPNSCTWANVVEMVVNKARSANLQTIVTGTIIVLLSSERTIQDHIVFGPDIKWLSPRCPSMASATLDRQMTKILLGNIIMRLPNIDNARGNDRRAGSPLSFPIHLTLSPYRREAHPKVPLRQSFGGRQPKVDDCATTKPARSSFSHPPARV